MKIHHPVDRKVRIEMLPLIDIVFLLLVFFIYAMLSMAVHQGLPVDLPDSSSAEVDRKLLLSVTVRKSGELFLNEQPVDLSELADALSAGQNPKQQQGVLLFADSQLPYQRLFNVMDQIRKAGIDRISLQAEKE